MVGGAQRGVDAGRRQGGHVECGADPSAPARETPPPAPGAVVAIEGRDSIEGGDLREGSGQRGDQGGEAQVQLGTVMAALLLLGRAVCAQFAAAPGTYRV